MNKHLLSLVCGVVAALLPAQETKSKVDTSKLRGEAEAALQKQDWTAAAATWRKVTEADPQDGEAWMKLGYSLHAGGKLDEALPVHEKAATFPRVGGLGAYNAACVHSIKGNKDKAFEWLDKAASLGFADADHMADDNDLDNIRKDPRYEPAVAKIRAAAARRGGGGGFQVFAQPPKPRMGTRIAVFGQSGSPGEIAIDYAVLDWKDSMEDTVNSPKMAGKKWRFGKDFWTNLDTSFDVEIGGVAVPAGYYYLTLEKRTAEAGDQFVLALHDAAAVRKQKLDAFKAETLKGGIEVPMQHKKADEVSKQLEIALTMDKDSQDTGALNVRFGPHALSAPLKLKLK
jgi:tetratricopeptide (TPR) repeat protein